MGCDIHFYVESFRDGKWVEVPNTRNLYNDRNYNLFSILANVRNGVGFEGISTEHIFSPIDEPRGLPDNISENIASEAKDWKYDAHSHSYFTLKELLEYDWCQKTIQYGYVNAINYYTWKFLYSKNQPDTYSGSVHGQSIKIIKEEEMNERIKKIIEDSKKQALSLYEIGKHIQKTMDSIFCNVKWSISYYQSCNYFWAEIIPQLLSMGKQDKVRIVFWFDN